ncbi:hypothetical protein IQ251_18450 [Saccharopolyspora sp. HNM0983]|uniref:Uncharacterized protein n=1 Tax=Saccharopolyspora montiporae TaxID=2781240 RepID=A0A929BFD1_9PSEU|nr:hypothetical protein [Saccharopolyspora sp. HNM0983]
MTRIPIPTAWGRTLSRAPRAWPVDLSGRVELGRQHLVQLIEGPGYLPVPQPSPAAGHPGAEPELVRQGFPADTGEQHEQEGRLQCGVSWPLVE